MTFHPDSLPDITGRVYIVTGGNSGIGYYTVARLAQHGAHVYLCARSQTKGNTAIANIKAIYPQAQITLLEIDHLSLASVVAAAKVFLSKENVLHGLINNAGIMCTPFEMSKDGFEAQWQTNYLAHWVLTFHLLPIMLQTSKTVPAGDVRIVNLSSSGHYSAPKTGINFADTSLATPDDLMMRYGQSKLANALFTKTLNNLYGPDSPSSQVGHGVVWTTTVHPGYVDTNLTTNSKVPIWLKAAVKVYAAVGGKFDADRGSWTSVYCAASKDMTAEMSGTYFQRIAEPGSTSSQAKDTVLASRLQEWTVKEMTERGWVS